MKPDNNVTEEKGTALQVFEKFVDDILQLLMKPQEYFSSLEKNKALGGAAVRALIYGVMTVVILILFRFIGLRFFAQPFWMMGYGITGFMAIPIQYLIMLFLSAAIVMVISLVCGGSNDYNESLQVTSSIMVLLPFSTALGFTAAWSILLSQVLLFCVTIYSIYLFYYGLTVTLKARDSAAKKAAALLAVLAFIKSAFTLRYFW